MRYKSWLKSAVLISVLNSNLSVFAQTNSAEHVQVERITAEQLLAMQGQSALDIIDQVAGFQFINSNNQRGLSNSSGNVLINGLPVLNKSQSLESVLSDLPINQLGEVQIYLAGHPFSSASQHTQVINLIRDTSENRINWRMGAKSHKGFTQPNLASIQANTQWQGWDHQLQLASDKDVAYSSTNYTELSPNNSALLSGLEHYQETIKKTNIGLTSSKPLANSILQVNALFLNEDYQEDYSRDWQNSDITSGSQSIEDQSQFDEYELGFDWQQQAAENTPAWLWQLTGLLRLREVDQNALTTEQDENGLALAQFKQNRISTEQVLKLASKQPALWWQPELGVEVSHNRLDADTIEDTHAKATSVNETRIEPFVAGKIELNAQWQLYTKLTGEYAKLSSESSHLYETQSRYFKPLLKLSHQADNGLQSTYTLQRKVDQLNFTDFLDSQDNDFGREQSGNTELKPQQSIELSYELNYEVKEHWTLNGRTFWQKQRDIHEFVRFSNGDWGVGNAGHAYYYGLDLNFRAHINWLIEDSLINLVYAYRNANYDDPLSGNRAISWLEPHSGEIEFRKEGAWFAWGILAALPDTETGLYPDEIYRQKDRATYGFYAELSLDNDMQINIELEDAFGGEYIYDRHIYYPDRTGGLDYRYYALEKSEPSLSLSLSGEF